MASCRLETAIEGARLPQRIRKSLSENLRFLLQELIFAQESLVPESS